MECVKNDFQSSSCRFVLARQAHAHITGKMIFIFLFRFAFCSQRIIPKAKVFSHINWRKKQKNNTRSWGVASAGKSSGKYEGRERIYIPSSKHERRRRVW